MNIYPRTIRPQIKEDLKTKIVLLCGPRQTGKTTLAKSITSRCDYLNYDVLEDRVRILKREWDRSQDLIIFDEIHKMKHWKSWLKGLYDGPKGPSILVTGSARLDLMRKAGDSLAGRHQIGFLFPFDIKELHEQLDATEIFNRLMNVGGFPEPFVKNSRRDYLRWRNSHQEVILRQDVIATESIREIDQLMTLKELLKERVGSGLSLYSLAQDLQLDSKTVKKYLGILENLFIGFTIHPYHHNIARSLLKEPKFYFFDQAAVGGEVGSKIENLVAISLYKEIYQRRYLEGEQYTLHYLRTKDQRELDFAIAKNNKIVSVIEVKTSDDSFSEHFKHFSRFIDPVKKIQLVHRLERPKTSSSGEVMFPLIDWLKKIDF